MTQPDALLRLTLEALTQLTNVGLGQRAQREVEAGTLPTITRADDGSLQAEFSDGVRTVFAPGAGIADARCSCGAALAGITTPTLVVHSMDDPFLYPENVPHPDQVGPGVRLAVQAHGGHVGFVEGRLPWRTTSLVDRLAPAFLGGQLIGAANGG